MVNNAQQRAIIISTLRKSAATAAQHAEHNNNKTDRWLKFQRILEKMIAQLSAAQDADEHKHRINERLRKIDEPNWDDTDTHYPVLTNSVPERINPKNDK